MCVYVDNIFLIDFKDIYLQTFKNRLKERFKIMNLNSISHYLRMSITRANNKINLN